MNVFVFEAVVSFLFRMSHTNTRNPNLQYLPKSRPSDPPFSIIYFNHTHAPSRNPRVSTYICPAVPSPSGRPC